MVHPTWKKLLFVCVVLTVFLGTVERADALWWGCCGPVYGGYSPCYTTCDPCGSGSLYLGWRPGPIRRLLFGPCRWYYGGCYSLRSSCCYTTYTPCCGEVPSCCGTTSAGQTAPAAPSALTPTPAQKPVIEAPAAPQTPPAPMDSAPMIDAAPSDAAPAAPAGSQVMPVEPSAAKAPAPETSGVVTVWVPYDAKVSVNGLVTKSVGSRRQFVSFGLKDGFSYKYEIHAEVVRDGKLQEDTRIVTLTAGQTTSVAFGFNTNPTEEVAYAKMTTKVGR